MFFLFPFVAMSLIRRFVPIINLQYGGLDFDLSYAPIERYPTRLPMVSSFILAAEWIMDRILTFWMIITFVEWMSKLFVP